MLEIKDPNVHRDMQEAHALLQDMGRPRPRVVVATPQKQLPKVGRIVHEEWRQEKVQELCRKREMKSFLHLLDLMTSGYGSLDTCVKPMS